MISFSFPLFSPVPFPLSPVAFPLSLSLSSPLLHSSLPCRFPSLSLSHPFTRSPRAALSPARPSWPSALRTGDVAVVRDELGFDDQLREPVAKVLGLLGRQAEALGLSPVGHGSDRRGAATREDGRRGLRGSPAGKARQRARHGGREGKKGTRARPPGARRRPRRTRPPRRRRPASRPTLPRTSREAAARRGTTKRPRKPTNAPERCPRDGRRSEIAPIDRRERAAARAAAAGASDPNAAKGGREARGGEGAGGEGGRRREGIGRDGGRGRSGAMWGRAREAEAGRRGGGRGAAGRARGLLGSAEEDALRGHRFGECVSGDRDAVQGSGRSSQCRCVRYRAHQKARIGKEGQGKERKRSGE